MDDILDDRVGFTTLNHKHAIIEDPVRRKVLFTSLIGGSENGLRALRAMRGLRLQPSRVDCGQLPVDCVRVFRLRLVNWGPETAFFRIKQPEKTSGIQVTYTPGPIPAEKLNNGVGGFQYELFEKSSLNS
ncbi:uncharacterized protein DEA37_0013056 [Paragonimus westermani]|uniref:Uncharacterized protein n=1 Tax=Paragonimus westermani TaxID=34504 RepID=A0A5J4NUL0_9TREM|nr:uncharacterized protein DEA37_0013056 [Paragonimus westermani]